MTGIIDAHYHIWETRDLPWLAGPMVPRIFGPYEAIRRDYPVAEYVDDCAGSGVIQSVYVQANWAPERFVDEVAWVSDIARSSGWPHGIVGYADFLADDVRPQLDRLVHYPLVRGVRMQLHWHSEPKYRFATRPDLMRDAKFQANIAHLADYGLSFDLQVFAPQMADAAALAADHPAIVFVLQHAGMPEDRSSQGRAGWRAGMAKLAACPNVVSKLSGLGTFLHRNDAGFIADIVADTMALFGSRRCLFGSNFPIEKLWTDYASLLGAYQKALGAYSAEDQANVFCHTARRIYRL